MIREGSHTESYTIGLLEDKCLDKNPLTLYNRGNTTFANDEHIMLSMGHVVYCCRLEEAYTFNRGCMGKSCCKIVRTVTKTATQKWLDGSTTTRYCCKCSRGDDNYIAA
jgi:hypothetical protein